MTRTAAKGFQKTNGTLIPEFDFETLTQTIIDNWGKDASCTVTRIPYSQFQTETGSDEPHPLANLGQTYVAKVEFGNNTANTRTFVNDEAMAAIDITKGIFGFMIWQSPTDLAAMGANKVKCLWETDSVTQYIRTETNINSTNVAGAWQPSIAIAEGTLLDGQLGGPTDFYDYIADPGGNLDFTNINQIRATCQTQTDTPFTFYITSMFYGARRKPVIMFEQDDLNESYPSSSGSLIGENGTLHLIEDANAAGIKVGFNGISSNVGSVNITEENLKAGIDAGHVMYGHGGLGMTDVSEAEALAQIDSELVFWRAFYPGVVTDETLMHHALPLGQTTPTIRDYMKSLGYKTIRNVGSDNIQGVNAQMCYNGMTYQSFMARGIDGLTSSEIIELIDNCIKHGIDMCMYIHQYNEGSTIGGRAGLQAILAHLKKRENEGLLDNMLRHEWYERSIKDNAIRTVA